MSDVIRLLPDSVANQIAAGEVIQRPASVIKELVENAVDAGAKCIKIVLKDAGRTLIQVVDDGCGMTETDARMAFERHATSKITRADDLFTLHTMGFRGEALPSIAAVAQVELRTMARGSALGTRIIINGSKVESQEPDACSPGTNMMVKNLFFNIPVRRKFLKKDSVELSNILREFERLALVNIDVEFTVIHNDITLYHILPTTMKRRIIDLFGKNFEHQLIPVDTDTSIVKINGYVGLPEGARKRGALQYLTVNGRNMRHPYFHKAILACYSELISADRQPNYFINFTVDPETIDVNIHPTKNEIKFENEQAVWQILTAAIREALASHNVTSTIDFDRDDAPEIPAFDPTASSGTSAPRINVDPNFNPFNSPSSSTGGSSYAGNGSGSSYNPSRRTSDFTDWEKLYADFDARLNQAPATPADNQDDNRVLNADEAPIGSMQIKNRYIVAPSREGMMIVDQHRAHITVLYERYLEKLSQKSFTSQQILFPETLVLSPSQNAVLLFMLDELASAGFKLTQSDSETNEWTIEAVPSELDNINAVETIMRMIDDIDTGNAPSDIIRQRLALSMARSTAISYDQPLNNAEREKLLSSLLSLRAPGFTPDGNPTMKDVSIQVISEMLNK